MTSQVSETTFSRQTSLSFLKILNASHKDFHRCSVAVLTRKKKTAVRRQPHSPLQLKLKCGEHSHHPISVSGCFPPPDLLCEQFSLMMSISPNVFIIFSGITRFSAQQAMFFIAGPACGEAKAELFTAIHSFLAVSVSFPILLCY